VGTQVFLVAFWLLANLKLWLSFIKGYCSATTLFIVNF
jgi:hypothetical protein